MVADPLRVKPPLHSYVALSPTLPPVAFLRIPFGTAGGVLQYVTAIDKISKILFFKAFFFTLIFLITMIRRKDSKMLYIQRSTNFQVKKDINK